MYVRALAPVRMHVCVHALTRVCVQACVQASECACMGVPRLGVHICVYTPVHACARMQWCSLVCPYDLQPLLLLPGAHPLWGCVGGAHTTLAPTPLPGKPKTGIFFFPQPQPSRAALPLFLGRKTGGLGGPFAAAALRSVGGGGGRGLGSFFLICSLHCTTMLRKIISPQRRAGEHKKKNGKKSETRGRGGGGRAGKGRPLRAKPFGDEPGSSPSLAVTPFFHSPPSCTWEPHGAPKLPPQNPAHYKYPPPFPRTRPGFGCHRMPTAGYRGAGTRATSLGAPITAAE